MVNDMPWPLHYRERPGTHCIQRWVGPRACRDVCGKFCPHPERPARSQSLYRLRYPGLVALLILVSISLKYIKTNNVPPLYYRTTPYWIILIIPGWPQLHATIVIGQPRIDSYSYILNYNVVNQWQGICVLYFTALLYMWYISHLALKLFSLPGIVMLSVLTTVKVTVLFELEC
jgi:hypothetical protein